RVAQLFVVRIEHRNPSEREGPGVRQHALADPPAEPDHLLGRVRRVRVKVGCREDLRERLQVEAGHVDRGLNGLANLDLVNRRVAVLVVGGAPKLLGVPSAGPTLRWNLRRAKNQLVGASEVPNDHSQVVMEIGLGRRHRSSHSFDSTIRLMRTLAMCSPAAWPWPKTGSST